MDMILLFLAGAFFANGVPHFVNGVSGRQFAEPFVYRLVRFIPNPLFNALWGMLSFGLSLALGSWYGALNPNFAFFSCSRAEFAAVAAGFAFAAAGLSLFFRRGGWKG
jgi:hypothetical protein